MLNIKSAIRLFKLRRFNCKCQALQVLSRSLSSHDSKSCGFIRQRYSDTRCESYQLQNNNSALKAKAQVLSTTERIKHSAEDIIDYFLPKGYPYSVGSGYKQYVQLQAIALLFSTTGGVLSMQSMLYAIGVGSGSIPLAATLNWIIKDGLGQLGGVIFASVVSNRFDGDPKRWRMVASGSMDASCFIELLTPLFPHLFLPLASIANVGKNISFLAASASRAAAHRAFATHENLADITAKAGSQSILCSMLGTGLGISVATAIGSISAGDASVSYNLTLCAFALCSSVNLAATYTSLTRVTLTTLNIGRFDFIFDTYLNKNEFLSPFAFSEREEYLGAPFIQGLPHLTIGPDLPSVGDSAELHNALELFRDENFVIIAQEQARESQGVGKIARVHLLLKTAATETDLVRGICKAFFVRQRLASQGYEPLPFQFLRDKSQWKGLSDVTQDQGTTLKDGSVIDREQETKIVTNFMHCLGLELRQGGNVYVSNENNTAKEIMDKSKKSSDARNCYANWHVEGLLLETRYARIEV
jgi:hypothetical protein